MNVVIIVIIIIRDVNYYTVNKGEHMYDFLWALDSNLTSSFNRSVIAIRQNNKHEKSHTEHGAESRAYTKCYKLTHSL